MRDFSLGGRGEAQTGEVCQFTRPISGQACRSRRSATLLAHRLRIRARLFLYSPYPLFSVLCSTDDRTEKRGNQAGGLRSGLITSRNRQRKTIPTFGHDGFNKKPPARNCLHTGQEVFLFFFEFSDFTICCVLALSGNTIYSGSSILPACCPHVFVEKYC